MLRAYVLDDEALAVDRLKRMLATDPRIELIGSSIDPQEGIEQIDALLPDLLFLDIEMPEIDGFGVLRRLVHQPVVIFTTAYDKYALQAFETNSIGYLLKPVEAAKLKQAVSKVESLRGAPQDYSNLLSQIATKLSPQYPERISSKTGDKAELVDLTRVSHFYAEDKLTFAATESKAYIIDQTISELEEKLDPARFFRVHRSTLVNLQFVAELYTYFGGKLIVKLKDTKKTEITVSKERAKELRDRLGV
ncbi:MAG: response regulator transcription factor [Acidobacteria bacterium]|nr:response regulator transcription factor [Acidobacteriota bacterium]